MVKIYPNNKYRKKIISFSNTVLKIIKYTKINKKK